MWCGGSPLWPLHTARAGGGLPCCGARRRRCCGQACVSPGGLCNTATLCNLCNTATSLHVSFSLYCLRPGSENLYAVLLGG